MVAGASRLLRPAVARRAVGSRCRCHNQAALRPSGGRGGRLQSAQTGAAVALLSHLHAVGSATGAAGCGGSRRSTQSQARRRRAVVVVGAARARALAAPVASDAEWGNEAVMARAE